MKIKVVDRTTGDDEGVIDVEYRDRLVLSVGSSQELLPERHEFSSRWRCLEVCAQTIRIVCVALSVPYRWILSHRRLSDWSFESDVEIVVGQENLVCGNGT